MLPRADTLGARPVAYVVAPTPLGNSTDARQEVYHRLNQIALGQQVPAKVVERLSDGTYLVRLADTSAKMSLPVGTKVGDQLSMTLVERQPRPTFLLGTEAKSDDAPATLSSAARLIDRLLQSSQQNGTSAAAIGRVPVLPSPDIGSSQVAAALQDAVDISGVFYESHLAQWVAGSRSLAALLREPQARSIKAEDASDSTQTESALLRHLVQQWVGSGRSLADLMAELQARTGIFLKPGADALTQQQAAEAALNRLFHQWNSSGEPMQQKSGTDQATHGVNAQSAQLINAQLNTLETQRFVWQGELWPGQPMEWEVSRDSQNGNQEEAQQEAWQSAVKFELPSLGSVSATIHLVGDRVSIFVRTDSEDSAALLRAHGQDLAQALEAAGSPLDALMVNQDGKD
jgi:hypothetical protein